MNIPGRTFLVGESFYSDWLPRGGDDAIFRAQLLAIEGNPVSEIEIYTKNREDSADGLVVEDSTPTPYDFGFDGADPGDTSQVIVQSVDGETPPQGIKELIRFKITVTGSSGEWQTIRIFPPVWMDRGVTS